MSPQIPHHVVTLIIQERGSPIQCIPLPASDQDKADVVAAELSRVWAGVEILIWAKALFDISWRHW